MCYITPHHAQAQHQESTAVLCDFFYQILLGWKTYKYCHETDELPNPRPTQPKKIVKKWYLGHFFPQQIFFRGLGTILGRKHSVRMNITYVPDSSLETFCCARRTFCACRRNFSAELLFHWRVSRLRLCEGQSLGENKLLRWNSLRCRTK